MNNKTRINGGLLVRTDLVTAAGTHNVDVELETILLVDSTLGDVTIRLPQNHMIGTVVEVKHIRGANLCDVISQNSDKIEDVVAAKDVPLLDSYRFMSDGTDWWLF